MKRLKILLYLLFTLKCCIFAQVLTRYNSNPLLSIDKYKEKKVYKLKPFDIQKFLLEDKEEEGLDVPFRFGKGFDTNYTLNDGEWTKTNYGRMWYFTIESEGALSLNFIFNNFHLSEGAYLEIVNSDSSTIYGPVTAESIPTDGFFMTDLIQGDRATIKLFEPKEKKGSSTLTIKKVIHRYRSFGINMVNGEVGASESCNNDISCYPEYEDESNAIGLILLANGTELCSGALIMSTDLSFKPYFLSAFHCIDTETPKGVLSDNEIAESERWMFIFHHKKKSCDSNQLAYRQTYNSAVFKAAYNMTDFALMEINGDLSNNTSLTWLGWDKTNTTPTSGASIHHPSGDVMKISFEDDSFQKTSVNGLNSHWLVYFDDGIVEHGSSGSPILNSSKRIVGQLTGNHTYNPLQSYCSQPRAEYGRFDLSWIGGGTDNTRLSNWLDPINSNINTINSSKPNEMLGASVLCDTASYFVTDVPAGYTISWSVDNNNFSVTPNSNQCLVTYTGIPQYETANLTASLIWNGYTVKSVTKRIVMHGTDMYLEGVQSGIYDENGDISAVAATFTIPAINGLRRISKRLSAVNRDSLEMTSLPVVFKNMRTTTIPDNPTYGITEIYGGADIYLDGERLDGMTISFSGDRAPEYLSADGGTMIAFRMPEVSSITDVQGYYYVVLHATSEGGCHDFDLYFKVIPVEGETIGDNEISLYYSDNSITVDFNAMEWTELPNGQLQATPWYLSIYRMSNGLQKHYSVNNTESRTVDISTWPADVYIVRVDSGENRYTKKFLKQ